MLWEVSVHQAGESFAYVGGYTLVKWWVKPYGLGEIRVLFDTPWWNGGLNHMAMVKFACFLDLLALT